MGLTLCYFGGTLTSNERYFRYGEQFGRSSSSDPEIPVQQISHPLVDGMSSHA